MRDLDLISLTGLVGKTEATHSNSSIKDFIWKIEAYATAGKSKVGKDQGGCKESTGVTGSQALTASGCKPQYLRGAINGLCHLQQQARRRAESSLSGEKWLLLFNLPNLIKVLFFGRLTQRGTAGRMLGDAFWLLLCVEEAGEG